MEEGGKRRPLAFRVPVADDYWHEYGVPLGLLMVALSAVTVLAARDLGDGVVVGATFVGLSAGAVLAGLVVYNVVVAALIAAKR
ncbi:hypothetical protein [Halorussus salinisoli]|uniref:hypothetical protein n=1 Tax=Halorussus salinisoli TaxID=2558242 RepID=UPI0010C1B58C|nr:hypothetical protein [Halorussus salinisoli]